MICDKHRKRANEVASMQVIGDVEGYERAQGSYFVCSNHNLADFDRVKEQEVAHRESHLSPNGVFTISEDCEGEKVSINDPFADRKLEAMYACLDVDSSKRVSTS